MSPEPLPLQPLLDALAERLAPKCPKPLRITADLRVPTLLADPEYWPEVMQNLVDNAIKYTRPDADAVEIHVSTRPATCAPSSTNTSVPPPKATPPRKASGWG